MARPPADDDLIELVVDIDTSNEIETSYLDMTHLP